MARIGGRPAVVYNAAEGDKFNADTTLEVVTCFTCGITYAIPALLKASALAYKGDRPGRWDICCPLGHTWHYVGETDAERLRRQLDAERARAGRLVADRDQIEASRRAQKAATTRARNQRDRDRTRIANGVCPCCNRSFKNVARHMASQHPGYGPIGQEDEAA